MTPPQESALGFPAEQLWNLIEQLLDSRISSADHARLQLLLLDCPEAQQFYLQCVDFHANLKWLGRALVNKPLSERTAPVDETSDELATLASLLLGDDFVKADTSTPEDTDAPLDTPLSPEEEALLRDIITPPSIPVPTGPPPVPGLFGRLAGTINFAMIRSILLVATVCYGSFLAVSWNLKDGKQPDQIASSPVAEITFTQNVAWQEKRQPQSIEPGKRFTLESGQVHLQLKQGASVCIQGPAEWWVIDGNRFNLQAGKLLAKVPHQATGFTVETPTSTIVDLGTEFGVEVDLAGEANVKVLRGRVQVQPNDAPAALLEAGEARRVLPTAMETITLEDEYFKPKPAIITGYLDLADIVCGGDGTGERRLMGIEPDTGHVTRESELERVTGDDRYHLVDLPFVDGIFIPRGGRGPVQINSLGQTFADFPATEDHSWGNLWVYADKSIYLHSNKGLTIDLEALRKHHHGLITQFTAKVQNLERSPPDEASFFAADVWVLVDDQVRFSAIKFRGSHGELSVDVRLDDTSRFLTLVATDSGNTIGKDGISFSNCRLALAADQNPSTP